MTGQTREVLSYTFLTISGVSFIRFGWCLVYLICDAESFVPAWVEKAVEAALAAKDKARLAFVTALLALALRLNAPVSAPKGALR